MRIASTLWSVSRETCLSLFQAALVWVIEGKSPCARTVQTLSISQQFNVQRPTILSSDIILSYDYCTFGSDSSESLVDPETESPVSETGPDTNMDTTPPVDQETELPVSETGTDTGMDTISPVNQETALPGSETDMGTDTMTPVNQETDSGSDVMDPDGDTSSTCAQEVLLCEDGTLVGRDPDNFCEFFPCPEPVACTQEVLQCPDGTFVGRVGPDCAFAPCVTTSDEGSVVLSAEEAPTAAPMLEIVESMTEKSKKGAQDKIATDENGDDGLLGLCQGKCKYDDDCATGLICFDSGSFNSVPGCGGTPIGKSAYSIPIMLLM
jgi:hypothetical protein